MRRTALRDLRMGSMVTGRGGTGDPGGDDSKEKGQRWKFHVSEFSPGICYLRILMLPHIITGEMMRLHDCEADRKMKRFWAYLLIFLKDTRALTSAASTWVLPSRFSKWIMSPGWWSPALQGVITGTCSVWSVLSNQARSYCQRGKQTFSSISVLITFYFWFSRLALSGC